MLAPLVVMAALFALGLSVCSLIRGPQRASAERVFALAFSLNLLLVVWIHWSATSKYGHPFLGESDAYRHEQYAKEALEADLGYVGTFFHPMIGHSDKAYHYSGAVAVMHKLTASLNLVPNTLVPRFVNSFAVSLLGVGMMLFGSMAGLREQVARLLGLACSWWPLVMFNSALVRRDAIFVLCFTMALCAWSIMISRRGPKMTLAAVAMCGGFLSSQLRDDSAQLLVAMSLAVWVVHRWRIRLTRPKTTSKDGRFFIAVLSVGLLIAFYVSYVGIDQQYEYLRDQFGLYTTRRGARSDGIGGAVFRLPLELSLPARAAYGLIYPPPIPNEFLPYNIRWVGTLLWYTCLPLLFWGLGHAVSSRRSSGPLIYTSALYFLVLFGMANGFTFTEGHQMLYFPFGLLLIFYSLQNAPISVRTYFPFLAFMGTMGFLVYVVLSYV